MERINNEHQTKMRQEFNRFTAEMNARMAEIDAIVEDKVDLKLKFHLEQFHHHLSQVQTKLEKHFGK